MTGIVITPADSVALARIEVKVDDTNTRVQKIEAAVFFGNGQPPITARITALEASSATTRWMLGVGIGAGTLLTAALTFLLRFLDLPVK